jgi:hypothetical protein
MNAELDWQSIAICAVMPVPEAPEDIALHHLVAALFQAVAKAVRGPAFSDDAAQDLAW